MFRHFVSCLLIISFSVLMVTAASSHKISTLNHHFQNGETLGQSQSLLKAYMADFAADLAKHLQMGSYTNNIIFSPVNVYSALALVQLAAAGATKTELETTLGWKSPQNDYDLAKNLGDILKALSPTLYNRDAYTKVKLANGIFVDKSFPVRSIFAQSIQDYYKLGKIDTVDFQNGNSATDTINNWASQATDGRIRQLFSEQLPSTSVMVLASSLYFSGKWDEPFHQQTTKIEKFDTGFEEIDVKMMRLVEYIPYVNNSNLQFEAICKDYADRDYTMIFVLPYESQTLENFTAHLTGDALRQIVNSTKMTGVEYKIPRFKFSMKKSLKEPLQERGLKAVFEKANLTKMVKSDDIKLSDIVHAAEIEINEEGTTASAITAVQVVFLSAPQIPSNPISFTLDHPFMMILYHRRTETFTFVGSVYKPDI